MPRRRKQRKYPSGLLGKSCVPGNYCIIPNAIFSKGLSTDALVILMYQMMHPNTAMRAASIGAVIGRTERTVEKYLRELQEADVSFASDNLNLDKNYFLLPKVIFNLGLSVGALAVYAYLMKSENRENYQCWPSMPTIGKSIGKTRKSVMAYVRELEEKQLIYTEPTQVRGKQGIPRNANLRYTLRNIEDAKRYHYQLQVWKNEKRAAKGRAS